MQSKNIPGIYNYCDRWCERCSLSSRCALFERERTSSLRPVNPKEKDLLSTLDGNLETTRQTLIGSLRAFGIDLDHLPAVHSPVENSETTPDRHPLFVKSFIYARDAEKWITRTDLSEYAETLNATVRLSLADEDSEERETSTLRDCTQVIMWYSTFIHVKLSRALSSVTWSDKWAEESGLQKDSDGSAKIALIAIGKSLDAWRTLLHLLPACEDDILGFLAGLQQLERLTKQSFPGALTFIRPGFDDHKIFAE